MVQNDDKEKGQFAQNETRQSRYLSTLRHLYEDRSGIPERHKPDVKFGPLADKVILQ